MLTTIVATIAVLGVLILVHELGHFLAARLFDIHVHRFSIGLGPKLFGWRRGETEYRVSAIPLGGYVKLAGMKEMEAIEGRADPDARVDPARTFAAKPAGARAVVLAAGVFMNAVLAVVLFAAIGMIWGRPTSPPPVVGGVVEAWLPDGARPLMDIPAGTRIVAVGDRRVETMDQVSRTIMAAHAGELTFRLEGLDPVTITIPEAARERQLLPIAIEPARPDAANGAAAAGGYRERLGPVAAVGYGLAQSWDLVTLMGGFFDGLVDGRHSPRELGGPVLIAQLSGAASRAGLPTLLFLVALLSINLAVINLLPIPLLDGGYLALLGVEAARGRPASERTERVLGRVGLAMVLALMVWGVTADVLRLLGA